MRKLICLFLILSVFFFGIDVLKAQSEPVIGAQVFIEPGQSPEQIESWFRILNETGMTVCRIRMFEEYMKKPDGSWDFSLFDQAFKAADKYHIKVFATLFPATINNSVGGFKFPESEEHLSRIATYIEKTVSHFKSFQSLYGWVLMNEPGTGGGVPDTEFTNRQFEAWKKKQVKPAYDSKNYTLLVNFDKEKFLLDYNTWYLGWIEKEIRKWDARSAIHVNNHQIFQNVAEYDFPAWRPFLTSLGASAHPSWHFGYFNRSQYAMALAANCEIIRSGAGELPFWITELQGGNNTYSGNKGFCPTAEEITQWLWTGVGSGVQGIIFWCLNPRSIGEEAGEWALLDFQNNPTDRMEAIRKTVDAIAPNRQFFDDAKPLDSPISIVYIRESLWAEGLVQQKDGDDNNYEGRHIGGVIKSAISFFEVLAQNGIKSNLKEIDEFDWNQKDYTGKCIILADQVSVPSLYWKSLENFVQKGGLLIVEGLTAFYDENMLSLNGTGFPLRDVFGGELSEVRCIPGDFDMTIGGIKMPVHLWKGYIHNLTGTQIAVENEHITAIENNYGKGKVVWTPSLIGLGAWRSKNKSPFSDFLRQELPEQIKQFPFTFKSRQDGMMMQTLKSGKKYLTVIINKSGQTKTVELTNQYSLTPKVLFSEKNTEISGNYLTIENEGTAVIEWE